VTENAIALENARPGTSSWRLTNPATDREIEGYASLTSVDRGGRQIDFFVSTQITEDFTYEVFRMGWYGGAGARLHLGPVTLQGFTQSVPPRDPHFGTFDCDWQRPFHLPGSTTSSWVSGVYLVRLTGLTSGKQSYVIFVLRDDASRSDYLFQSSVLTFQAYNPWPGPPSGMSLYAPGGTESTGLAALKVSFNRPYGVTNLGSAFALGQSQNVNAAMGVGAGEFLTNLSSDRFTMAGGWEYNLVRFLEREGYDVSYVTNVDVHTLGAGRLLQHRALLSVGHDEYWTWEMRDAVESARDQGLNIGFFSSNTCYWQARLEASGGEENRILVVYKDDIAPDRVDFITGEGDQFLPAERRTHLWTSVGRPEAALVGVGNFHAPSAGPESFYSADLVVYDPTSFVFADTGLSWGDTLRGLVGMETESIQSSSPPGIARVAHSPTAAGVPSDMVVYTAASGSTVISTDSMQWSWGLDDLDVSATRPAFASDTARLITRNILERLRTSDNQVDSFNTHGVLAPDLDLIRWAVGAVCEGPPSPGVTVEQGVDSLLLAPTPDFEGFNFNGIVSSRRWNLSGKQIRVCALDTGSAATDTFFAITNDHENWYRIIREGDLLYFQANVNGTRTWMAAGYSPTDDLWWQMRHNPVTSSILFETSPDGVGWQYRYEFPSSEWLGNAYVELQAGTMTAAADPGVARFQSLAVEPSRPWADAGGFDDDFAEYARDEDRWRVGTLSIGELEGAAWVAQGGGAMEIRPPARSKRPFTSDATTFVDGPNYSGYVTRERVSFVHKAVSVEVIEASGGVHGVTFFGIGVDEDNWSRFLVTDGMVFLELTDAGQTTLRQVPHNPSAQRWWRIAHRPPSFAFETSADGISWVSELSFDQPAWLGRGVRIELQAGSEWSDDAPSPARFGSFSLGSA
jgi:hypothetical protein